MFDKKLTKPVAKFTTDPVGRGSIAPMLAHWQRRSGDGTILDHVHVGAEVTRLISIPGFPVRASSRRLLRGTKKAGGPYEEATPFTLPPANSCGDQNYSRPPVFQRMSHGAGKQDGKENKMQPDHRPQQRPRTTHHREQGRRNTRCRARYRSACRRVACPASRRSPARAARCRPRGQRQQQRRSIPCPAANSRRASGQSAPTPTLWQPQAHR